MGEECGMTHLTQLLEPPLTRCCFVHNKYGGSRPRGQSLLRYQPVCLWYHYKTAPKFSSHMSVFSRSHPSPKVQLYPPGLGPWGWRVKPFISCKIRSIASQHSNWSRKLVWQVLYLGQSGLDLSALQVQQWVGGFGREGACVNNLNSHLSRIMCRFEVGSTTSEGFGCRPRCQCFEITCRDLQGRSPRLSWVRLSGSWIHLTGVMQRSEPNRVCTIHWVHCLDCQHRCKEGHKWKTWELQTYRFSPHIRRPEEVARRMTGTALQAWWLVSWFRLSLHFNNNRHIVWAHILAFRSSRSSLWNVDLLDIDVLQFDEQVNKNNRRLHRKWWPEWRMLEGEGHWLGKWVAVIFWILSIFKPRSVAIYSFHKLCYSLICQKHACQFIWTCWHLTGVDCSDSMTLPWCWKPGPSSEGFWQRQSQVDLSIVDWQVPLFLSTRRQSTQDSQLLCLSRAGLHS